MHRCLALAERGRGKVGTNPLVGAVLVRRGEVIAEGWHAGFGLPHAERVLLDGYHGDVDPEDVLYVNLEPCCHRGKTPPCTEILQERGVKRVVYGMIDPNAQMAGKGIEALRRAQVECIGPFERARCEWMNRGFVSLHTKSRLWVTLKRAQLRDGEIAAPGGASLKITSASQDRWAHEWLRGRHDAILVGVQTVITDDPLLTVRSDRALPSPLRIVLDPHCRIPPGARIISGALAAGTVVIVGPEAESAKCRQLRGRGVQVLEVPLLDRRFDYSALWRVLMTPTDGFHGIASVLVEGGAKTWQSFREEGAIDEEVILMGDG